MIFNLDWKRFDIESQVSAANARMAELTEKANLTNYMIFNLASVHAGEWITSFDPDVGNVSNRTVNFLRRMHYRVKRSLDKDKSYRANRDALEMLDKLKSRGHNLSAVWSEETKTLEESLKRSRSLDYFGDEVLGGDSVSAQRGVSMKEMYHAAIARQKASPHDVIIVADNPWGISEAKAIQPFAVFGYVNLGQKWNAIAHHMKELEKAGADFAIAGGHTVSIMPDLLLHERLLHSGSSFTGPRKLQ